MGLFQLDEKVIVVTGATGVLAGSVARYLASCGARIVLLGRNQEKLEAVTEKWRKELPNVQCLGCQADVLDRGSLEASRDAALKKWGRIDGLINGAGGNMPGATVQPGQCFQNMDYQSFRDVMALNLDGTVLPSMVFAPALEERGSGSIVNFSSVSAQQAISRVVGYSAAKAAVENFTRWLAVELAKRTGGGVRVNAVLPGFFIGEQNRRLLTNEDGSLTERGHLVVNNTPFGRFGEAEELHGAIHYLLSDASKFVTGTILPVDGGFIAYSGV